MRDACLVSKSQKTLDNRSIDNHWGLVQSPPSFILETVCTLRIFQGTVLVSKIRKLLPQHPLSTHSIHNPRLPEKLRVVSRLCVCEFVPETDSPGSTQPVHPQHYHLLPVPNQPFSKPLPTQEMAMQHGFIQWRKQKFVEKEIQETIFFLS